MSYKAHLFICTAAPDKPGKCGNKGSDELRTALKKACQKESWSSDVRINSSGCLDYCENGIAAVLYPEGEWFLNQTKDDFDRLFSAVKDKVQKLPKRETDK
jgi:(2Fe-2S) ferredoxin